MTSIHSRPSGPGAPARAASVVPSPAPFVAALLAPAFLLVACLLASCGSSKSEEVVAEPQPIAVRVAEVVSRDQAVTLDATGNFEAQEASEVAPETSGRVDGTPVDVGSFVVEGAVLVRLQGVSANLGLDEARAVQARAEANVKLAESQSELARTTAERYAKLLASGDVSQTVADQARTAAETNLQSVATARAQLAEANARLALSEKNVADVAVRAPFSGYVQARHVALGEFVSPSTPVVTLLKVDPLRLLLTLPGIQAGQVALGQTVAVTVDSYPGESFEGTITAVNPALDPTSRTFRAEARVKNTKARLKPGMFGVATLDLGRTEKGMFVPRAAIVEDANTNSFRVYVIDAENRARLRVVRMAPGVSGDQQRLLTGVEAGERVATTALADLYDSAPVTVDGLDDASTAAAATAATTASGNR
jgi:membrane fusion protein (multidrug efflux system)